MVLSAALMIRCWPVVHITRIGFTARTAPFFKSKMAVLHPNSTSTQHVHCLMVISFFTNQLPYSCVTSISLTRCTSRPISVVTPVPPSHPLLHRRCRVHLSHSLRQLLPPKCRYR